MQWANNKMTSFVQHWAMPLSAACRQATNQGSIWYKLDRYITGSVCMTCTVGVCVVQYVYFIHVSIMSLCSTTKSTDHVAFLYKVVIIHHLHYHGSKPERNSKSIKCCAISFLFHFCILTVDLFCSKVFQSWSMFRLVSVSPLLQIR